MLYATSLICSIKIVSSHFTVPVALAFELDEAVDLLDDPLHAGGLEAALHSKVEVVVAAVVLLMQEARCSLVDVRPAVQHDALEQVVVLHVDIVLDVDHVVERLVDVVRQMTMLELAEADGVLLQRKAGGHGVDIDAQVRPSRSAM
jgi:hypothetical protein